MDFGNVSQMLHFFALFRFPALLRSLPGLAWAATIVLHRRYAPPSWQFLLQFIFSSLSGRDVYVLTRQFVSFPVRNGPNFVFSL